MILSKCSTRVLISILMFVQATQCFADIPNPFSMFSSWITKMWFKQQSDMELPDVRVEWSEESFNAALKSSSLKKVVLVGRHLELWGDHHCPGDRNYHMEFLENPRVMQELEELTFEEHRGQYYRWTDLEYLDALTTLKKLRKLSLKGDLTLGQVAYSNKPTEEWKVSLIGKYIGMLQGLEALEIECSYIQPEFAKGLVAGIGNLTKLKKVSMLRNNFDSKSFDDFAEALGKIKNLESLSLYDNSLGDKEFKVLANTLPNLINLCVLWINEHQGLEGTISVAKSIKHLNKLKRLSFNCSGEGNEELLAFSECFPYLAEIFSISLDQCKLTDAVRHIVINGISNLQYLESLTLDSKDYFGNIDSILRALLNEKL